VHYEAIALADMVEQASLVLVAKRAVPATMSEEISIVPPGKQPDPQKFPPFTRVKSRWVFVEALKSDRKITPGRTLEIDSAHWQTQLELQRRYYVEGVSKSPIYRRYKGAKVEGQAQVILFLREDDQGLLFVADRAMESMDKLGEIKRLLAKRK
jgi:hypothetical protein